MTSQRTLLPTAAQAKWRSATMRSNESDSGASLTDFTASYTSKDLILYALALGFGSEVKNYDKELRYLFEQHASFSAVPSFPLVLPFWADQTSGNSSDIKSFPPPLMKAMGVLPRRFLRAQATLDEKLPILHTSQTITWHRPVPTRHESRGDSKIQTHLSYRVLSVAPKSVGTFVTSETRIWSSDDSSLICTLQGTNLVLGMPANDVIPYGKLPERRQRNDTFDTVPAFEWTYKTLPNQALFYRMASGDSNIIHVDPNTVSLVGTSKRPLLHGLCTLGIAVRGIMMFLRETSNGVEQEFTRLEADFTKPVFVGDALLVTIWEEKLVSTTASDRILFFRVSNSGTGTIVIDNGRVKTKRAHEGSSSQRARL